MMGEGRVQAVAVLNRAEAAVRGVAGDAGRAAANARAFVDVLAGRFPAVECAAAEGQGRAVERVIVEAIKDMQRSAGRVREAWREAAAKEQARREACDGGAMGKRWRRAALTAWNSAAAVAPTPDPTAKETKQQTKERRKKAANKKNERKKERR